MLKFSKVILHLATLNLTVFLSASFVCADVINDNKADIEISKVKQSSKISSSIVDQICRNSDASILENTGNWYMISINGSSGWVNEKFFPVESILAAEKVKTEVKTEVNSEVKAEANSEVISDENYSDTEKKEQEVSNDETDKFDNEQIATAEAKSSVVMGIVDGDDVNVRKGPGKEYGVICQVNTGDGVEILEIDSEWYHITTSSGVDGWIYSDYIVLDTVLASRGSTTYENVADKRSEIVLFAKDLLGVK